MLTQYIENPGVPGNCQHNTAEWQVTELMGGLAAELLRKNRVIDAYTQAQHKMSLHSCYPSVFFQGDDARVFLQELTHAQALLNPNEVDRLMLSNYRVIEEFA
jgi:hypothetical protein